MARLNIEDEFWIAIMNVAVKVGDMDRAIGNATRFLRLSQERFKKGRAITKAEFKSHGFLDSLFPEVAEYVEGGIQAVGAEEHFAWLKNRSEAGKKGGKSRSDKKLSSLKQNQTLSSEANQSKSKQTEASYSYSPSYSPSYSDSPSPSRTAVAGDVEKFEARFRGHENPDRERYREVLRNFVSKTDSRLKNFQTERHIDQAMYAFANPSRFFDYLDSLAQTWKAKKPENAQAYFKTSWRENVLERAGDVELTPVSEEVRP